MPAKREGRTKVPRREEAPRRSSRSTSAATPNVRRVASARRQGTETATDPLRTVPSHSDDDEVGVTHDIPTIVDEPPPPEEAAQVTVTDELWASDSDENSESFFFPEEHTSFGNNTGNTSRLLRIGNQQPVDAESDSSEDDAVLNRVGDIPLEWYQDEEHVGYDVDGNKILRPKQSALDQLLDATDNRDALRTIVDPLTGERKVLSNKDLQLIFNLQRNRAPNPEFSSMYDDYTKPETSFDALNHPLARSAGPSKKTFVPRLHEMKRLQKMIARKLKALEEGQPAEDDEVKTKENKDEPYMLWDDAHVEMDDKTKFRYVHAIDKPKPVPPGTYESYRPPPEYLPSEFAKKRFERTRRIDRKEHFLPQQFAALRHVPFYHHYIQDSYQRCLDLAFFPRMTRVRLVVDPEKLLPELPNPKDLKPYPERLSFHYKGHTGTARWISVSPNGQFIATACDDHMVRVFETLTGRLMKRYDVGEVPQQVSFSPSKTLNVIAVAVEFALLFIVPPFAAHRTITEHTLRHLRAPGTRDSLVSAESEDIVEAGLASAGGRGITQAAIDADETAYHPLRDLHDEAEKTKRAEFVDGTASERAAGIVVKVVLHGRLKRFAFHGKGDYLCALCPKDHVKYRQTVMLQLSTRKVFCPFRKFSEVVTACAFHPTEPLFFLATTNSIRCYNLLQHRLQKKYKAQGGITTCLDVHPLGDNFLVGDTSHRTMWYDCDFSDQPYRRMKSHKGVVNCVKYHPNTDAYPLFATASSDGQVHVFHGMVYDDYNKNALIVPVKILKHTRPVYCCAWHPTLPWLFTSAEDGTVCCWTE